MLFNRNKLILIITVLLTCFIITTQIYSRTGRSHVKPLNPGFPINTEGDDFSPCITEDGNTMVFNSKLPSEKVHNIYICFLENDGWSKPEFMKEINSEGNDETPFITPDGKTLLFSSDRQGSLWPSITADGRIRTTFDIYISHLVKGKWTKPKALKGSVNTIMNERSPAMSRDKKIIYFSRWPFMRLKDSKIMQAEFHYDSYIRVTPLPPVINSGNFDLGLRPSINRSGFFFSSRKPDNFGGWDLYFIQYKNGILGNPINLGKGINSPGDEIALTESGSMLYFCSNRSNGLGRYDIYAIRTPRVLKKIKIGRVPSKRIEEPIRKKTGKHFITKKPNAKTKSAFDKPVAPVKSKEEKVLPKRRSIYDNRLNGRTKINFRIIKKRKDVAISTKVKVYLKDTDNPAARELRFVEKRSDRNGTFSLFPKKDVKWVVVKIKRKGYKPLRSSIKVRHGRETNITIELNAEKKNKTLKKTSFKPIFFRFNSDHIEMKYYPHLHKIIDYMRKHPKSRILITGHSDMYGKFKSNKKLSIRRARTVRNYLEKLGIRIHRINIKGMANLQPYRCVIGKKENRINRRVEFLMR